MIKININKKSVAAKIRQLQRIVKNKYRTDDERYAAARKIFYYTKKMAIADWNLNMRIIDRGIENV